MSATVEELERRLAHVEKEVTRLRQQIEPAPPLEAPSDRGARLLHEARMSQPAIAAAAALQPSMSPGSPPVRRSRHESVSQPQVRIIDRHVQELLEDSVAAFRASRQPLVAREQQVNRAPHPVDVGAGVDPQRHLAQIRR